MRLNIFYILLVSLLIFFSPVPCISGIKEEKEERSFKEEKIEEYEPTYELNMRTAISFGYDSNVRLDGARKGDAFEEFLFSARFKKELSEEIALNFRYTLDSLNYSEVTGVSNLLNRLVWDLNKDIFFLDSGIGYDFSYLYYPHYQNGDFLFHKGFFYIGDDLTKNLYHRLKFYYGLKSYLKAKALGDTSGSYQDKERKDKRQYLEYSLKWHPDRDLTLRLKTAYSINDSNARYIDYYDYESPRIFCGLNYRLNPDLYFLLNYTHQRKKYKSRTATSETFKQEDDLYSLNLGFIYFLRKNSFSLNYTFRKNSSNDSLADYSENVISCGWQYYF